MKKLLFAVMFLLGCAPVWATPVGYAPVWATPKSESDINIATQAVPKKIYAYYSEINLGFALPAENIKVSESWEIRGGIREDQRFMRALSLGFSNYSSDDTESAPDRLAPGGITLRTINAEFRHSFLTIGKFRLNAGGGFGWTWVAHSPRENISLNNGMLTKERVHDNFSATIKLGTEYKWKDSIVLEGFIKYFTMHTFRERDVLFYGSTNSPVSFDHFTLSASLKLLFD